MKYNKLVRDKIPAIINKQGQLPIIHTASQNEYSKKLTEKLQEEVKEFLESNDPEELADILEVVYTLGNQLKFSKSKLEKLRDKKAKERGGFKKKIILEEVTEN